MDEGDTVRRIFRLDADDPSAGAVPGNSAGDRSRCGRVLIYTAQHSPRLEFVCEFIFAHVLGTPWRITTDAAEIKSHDDCSVNYSAEDIPDAFRILPQSLLFEKGVASRQPQPVFRDKQIYFFPNGEKLSGLHFDLFSAVFFFISRMEEWQPFTPDEHGRFEAEASLPGKHGYLQRPVVDEWITEFSREIRRRFPRVTFRERGFRAISTIDVDNVYAYRNKGLARTVGGAVKDILRGDVSGLFERMNVVLGLRNDPFDIYESISAFCRDHNVPLFYFFLMRSGTKYDRTIDPARGVLKQVLADIGDHTVGLHPSYDASHDEQLLSAEVSLLSEFTGRPVGYSRQHFLRFDIKETPHLLIRNGIKADFSMGFARSAGFRAGTTYPFYYYDIAAEKKTDLLFVPFCMMDGAFSIYNKTDARTAMVELLALASVIRETGGFFVSVFHERTFSDRLYRGFGTLYKKLHERLCEME